MEKSPILKKSILSLGGNVRMPEGFVMPFRISHSTAGPGAGEDSAVFAFDGLRLKKNITYGEEGEFEFHVTPEGYSMTHNGEPFIDRVEIRPIAAHSPEQAFFTIDPRCIYNCAYCTSPTLPKQDYKGLSPEDMVEKTRKIMQTQTVKSIGFTSGIYGSVQDTVDRFEACVRAFKEAFPDLPVGVMPYLDDVSQIRQLKDAGAEEISLNIECSTRRLMDRVCPDLDYDLIYTMLEESVKVFGRGKVTSTVIFGIGETEEELFACVDRLCDMGVVPLVRSLRRNPLNEEKLQEAVGDPIEISPEENVRIAGIVKEKMAARGLTTETFSTMCVACRCCELVPFTDFRGVSSGYPRIHMPCNVHRCRAPHMNRTSDRSTGIPVRAWASASRKTTICCISLRGNAVRNRPPYPCIRF